MRQPRELRPYRRTLMDRYGPDFGRMLYLAGWSTPGGLMILLIALHFDPLGWPRFITVPLYFSVGWALTAGVALLLVSPGDLVAGFYLAPTGASTPYQEQFSREQTLVMRGRVDEALQLYEARISAEPTAVPARIRAAELYAGLGKNPQRAAELFREAQRVPGLASGDDLYVSNRLADLFVGPLATPTRALVELRRLLDRYPNSKVAPQLRQAIASLKSRHLEDDREP